MSEPNEHKHTLPFLFNTTTNECELQVNVSKRNLMLVAACCGATKGKLEKKDLRQERIAFFPSSFHLIQPCLCLLIQHTRIKI